jgi:PH domain/leucine-rich repeat-containing protein phosphatase
VFIVVGMYRKLRSTGQRLGASGVLLHIQRHADDGQMNHFTLNVANVGDVEAVLCRRGEALMLTRKFVAVHDREEISRIVQHDGIITEVTE